MAPPAANVWRHEPDINLYVAAIFDPFGNAVHSALTFPVLWEDVLISGAGPIGLMAAIVARHAGVPASDHSRIGVCVVVRQLPGRPARRSTCRARARSEVGGRPAPFRGQVVRVAVVGSRYQNVI